MLPTERSRDAQRDLVETYAYLYNQASERVAERFLSSVEKAFGAIASMPGIGTLFDSDTPDLNGMRWWPVSGFHNYLIFYKATDTSIEVIRVLHGARNFAEIFSPSE